MWCWKLRGVGQLCEHRVSRGGRMRESAADRRRVGVNVTDQSLVVLPRHSDLFVILRQMFSWSWDGANPRAPLLGSRVVGWRHGGEKGTRPESVRLSAGESQLLYWRRAAQRGLGLIDSSWLQLLQQVAWPNYQGRDANKLVSPFLWEHVRTRNTIFGRLCGAVPATNYNDGLIVPHPEEEENWWGKARCERRFEENEVTK